MKFKTSYGGQLEPAVVIANGPAKIKLQTEYPFTKDFPIGHSWLLGTGNNSHFRVNFTSANPEYNLFTNNCSDNTCKVIESLSGKKAPDRLFTTPGTVRDFVKSVYGNTKDYKESKDSFGRIVEQTFTVPLERYQHVRDSLNKLRLGGILKFQKGKVINYSGINKNAEKNLQYIDSELEKAGYGYIQRLAILGNIQRESSGNPLAISPNGKWHGIIQWDKNRYRIQSKNEQEELKRQTAHLIKELEKTGWSGWTWKDQVNNLNSFKNLKDLNQAVDLFTRHFVRPANINSEIQKRLAFAQQGLTDSEYDLDTALQVLPKEEISAWKRNPEENHLSTGYTDEQENYHYLKSSQHESYPESREYERKDPETSKAMTRYMNPNNSVSKFQTYSLVTSGLPESVTGISQLDLIYRPMVMKRQQGGLVYKPFIYNREKQRIKGDSQDLIFDFLNSEETKYPVEKVEIYQPTTQETQPEQKIQVNQPTEQQTTYTPTQTVTRPTAVTAGPISTTSFHEESVEAPVVKGLVEYKVKGLDIGNMQELIDLMVDEGIRFRVTSGNRPGAKTKQGRPSHHGSGNALDITPIQGETWDDLINQMKRSRKFISYMNNHGLGILDERGKDMQNKTGANGAHFHIGPDLIARTQFKYLIG